MSAALICAAALVIAAAGWGMWWSAAILSCPTYLGLRLMPALLSRWSWARTRAPGFWHEFRRARGVLVLCAVSIALACWAVWWTMRGAHPIDAMVPLALAAGLLVALQPSQSAIFRRPADLRAIAQARSQLQTYREQR